ncbi:hypothetical protein BGZ46_000895 [Entomortierella lignicola]|nr:hypothetical protein BGZ46_000895 [Entomortierella lignicola]
MGEFPFPDHSPPPFQLIHPFCEDVSDWLHTKDGNVVAVHCKAGKGRTGVMLCSFLVHCGATANDAIKLYGEKRTHDGFGVTIPSQVRYIHYYEQFLESRTLNYDPRLLSLHEIIIDTIPKPLVSLESGANYLILTIMSGEVKIYESLPQHCTVDLKLKQLRISISDKVVLGGDVKMMLWYDNRYLYKRSHLCHFHFNTTFIDKTENALYLTKSEVDKACKDKLHAIFDKDFHISVRFSPALAQQSPLPTLDSIPNRAILLKYKNHNGPNSVQVSPPYFSSVRTSPPRNKFSLDIFGLASDSADDDAQKSSPPNSNGSDASCSTSTHQLPHTKNGPVLVHSNRPVFKPVWSDKDADRDDNWDTSSVGSDFSESDSVSEWWYTKPPQPTIHSSTSTAEGTASASIVQPEMIVRTGPDTKGFVFTDIQEEVTKNEIHSQSHFRPAATPIAIASVVSSPIVATSTAISSSAVYRSPPHSSSSPLAREIKFDSLKIISKQANISRNSLQSGEYTDVASGRHSLLKSNENDSLAGSYLNEEGEPIDNEEAEIEEGRDSGIENYDSKYRDHEREREAERERGWVDSVSRWLWSVDGDRGEQEPNGTERQR